MIFIDPCRKCIVKACCNKGCEKKENFYKFYDIYGPLIILLLFLLNVSSVIFMVIYILKFLNYTLLIRFLILFTIWLTPFTILVLKDRKEFIEEVKDNPVSVLGVCLVIPTIVFVITTVPLIEKIIGTELI